ncbi:hypothetical protein NOS3756_10740 [Nostoc sp. NIES-3756]|uniref:hypothetical protein n=1 Tax=Nostoc sp. NIES-3756 TaxID=1751286 RepID=UPI00071F91CE|nr:hypothetical protein [Nostoc sp. NIES-3756]BAT52142.1 hypothetical protein NOS3756_10740 [Nostoc sp. NIES-3756]BAY40157.1 hypothetical protein NIES2111_45400 [Nostoc sp. NIES-2111]
MICNIFRHFLIVPEMLYENDSWGYFLTSRRSQIQIVPLQTQGIKADTLTL